MNSLQGIHSRLSPSSSFHEEEKQAKNLISLDKQYLGKEISFPNFDREKEVLEEGVTPYFFPNRAYQAVKRECSSSEMLSYIKESGAVQLLQNLKIAEKEMKSLCGYLRSEECKIEALKFTNCSLSDEVFSLLCKALKENQTVSTLQFEGSALSKKGSLALKELLQFPLQKIQTLNFVCYSIPVVAFDKVVEGILEQNTYENAVRSLCFEGCRLNKYYSEGLEKLIKGSTRLKTLMLQGNRLGSKKLFSPKIDPAKLASINGCKEMEKRASSRAVGAIANSLNDNQSLEALILTSNGIGLADYKELLKAITKNNRHILINLAGNALENLSAEGQLITQRRSSRSLASPVGVE